MTFFSQHTNQLTTFGIYSASTSGGAITKVVDNNTAIPNGTGNFTDIGFATVSGSNVAFYGNRLGNNQEGIYAGTTTGGALIRIADRNTPIPNSTGNFLTFGTTPSISGSSIAFKGESSAGFRGIYVGDISNSSLIKVADTNTPIPGGIGNFGDFSQNPAISGTLVAFLGTGNFNQLGLYYEDLAGGPLNKLIASGDALDGRTVSALQFGLGGLDGNSLTFEADFTNGTSGIYYVQFAPVPEPGVIVATTAMAIAVGWSMCKRCPFGFADLNFQQLASVSL